MNRIREYKHAWRGMVVQEDGPCYTAYLNEDLTITKLMRLSDNDLKASRINHF